MSTVSKAALLLLAALPAAADEVILNNGSVLSGVVREEFGRVIIEVEGGGTMTFDRSHVRSVRKTGDLIKEYEERLKGAADAQTTYDLAVWARGKGLQDRANTLYRKVIALDPDHAEARKALGFERIHGAWLQGDELMAAKGFIKVNGQWTREEVALRIREQDLMLQIERERIASNERIVKVQADLEYSRIAAERERVEIVRHNPNRCTDTDHGWSARFSCRPAAHLVSPPPAPPGVLVPDRGCRAPAPASFDRWSTPPLTSTYRSNPPTYSWPGGGPPIVRRTP